MGIKNLHFKYASLVILRLNKKTENHPGGYRVTFSPGVSSRSKYIITYVLL